MPGLILVVEDEAILAESISAYLQHHGHTSVVALSGEEGLRRAEEAGPDVALVDLRLPGMDGFEVLRKVREVSPFTEVIIITAYASVASAVEAMRLGAFDYLTKPLDLGELRVLVDKALAHGRMRQELSYLKTRDEAGKHVSEIVGECPGIHTLRAQIERIATIEPPAGSGAPTVLIVGETGTGKQLVARAIHYRSPRGKDPFVEINCGAIPATLLEAELFGYEKGAYTDAKTAKPGLFEAAQGGTLFLDEIGNVDPGIQVKLLKAIEEKSLRRLGAVRAKRINVRIIAATNRDLAGAIAEGSFRSDLYYRINVLTIQVPPLRTRGADITLLAQHFLDQFARQYGRPAKQLSPEAKSLLTAHAWPGNVRELAHVIERAALLHEGTTVKAEDLEVGGAKVAVPVVLGADGTVQVDFPAGGIVLDDVERQLIVQALHASVWNRAWAAQLLGISKETLRYRMEKYSLRPPQLGVQAGEPTSIKPAEHRSN